MSDDDETLAVSLTSITTPALLGGLEVAALIAALFPLVLSVSGYGSVGVDYVAISFAALAIVHGLFAAVRALRAAKRGVKLAIALAIVLAGGLQVARGFGAFAESPRYRSS